MLGTLARGAYLLFLAAMILAYALSANKDTPPPKADPHHHIVVYWNT